MALTSAHPTLPWEHPTALPERLDLGPGIDGDRLRLGLLALIADPEVKAVVGFGSRARGESRSDSDLDLVVIIRSAQLTPQQKLAGWRRYRALLGSVPVGVDLLVTGWGDAARMAQSRWHVMGDVAREGKVLYAAR
ncbi:nucleotidyltransferase family protein [Cyanobium sp. Morenito 9A2]|uniref:nucleotidyltransferase family protein n=1 Tax=Cyanobium sp. Morenito 9A2 TaxID=2823718 RepID=UPI0020CF52A4|nr:nucleotidyltransferase domain-containing protein [Cyanobium sp. Morenito 9A2]MCP9849800.1 nucleotidyltransferase domain-containing protein [Cyanobium sp. Morenito 9A2]